MPQNHGLSKLPAIFPLDIPFHPRCNQHLRSKSSLQPMRLFFPLLTLAVSAALFLAQAADTAVKPLRVLIVAGGCCHEYDKQHLVLKEGIESRINAIVDVAYNPDKTTKATFEIYKAKEMCIRDSVVISRYSAAVGGGAAACTGGVSACAGGASSAGAGSV